MKTCFKGLVILLLYFSLGFSQSQEHPAFNKLIHFSKDKAPIHKYFVDMSEDVMGNIWLITYNQISLVKKDYNLSKFDGINWTRYTKNDGVATDKFYALHSDSKGNVWVATSGGICRFDGTNWELTTTRKEFLLVNTRKIFEDSKGNIWAGGEDNKENMGQVGMYDGAKWSLQKTKGMDKYWGIKTIFEDSNDIIWVGVGQSQSKLRGRVRNYDGNKWKIFKPKLTNPNPTMPNKCVQTITEDNEGNIWIGEGYGNTGLIASNGGGIKMYDGQNWKEFTIEDGLPDSRYLRITDSLIDSNGNVWYTAGITFLSLAGAGEFGGVYKYDGKKWSVFTIEDGLPSKRVLSILEDNNGNIWIGTDYGIAKYNGEDWTIVISLSSYGANAKLLKDRKGDIWCATYLGGIFKLEL